MQATGLQIKEEKAGILQMRVTKPNAKIIQSRSGLPPLLLRHFVTVSQDLREFAVDVHGNALSISLFQVTHTAGHAGNTNEAN